MKKLIFEFVKQTDVNEPSDINKNPLVDDDDDLLMEPDSSVGKPKREMAVAAIAGVTTPMGTDASGGKKRK